MERKLTKKAKCPKCGSKLGTLQGYRQHFARKMPENVRKLVSTTYTYFCKACQATFALEKSAAKLM
jgi:ribosomal protein L34E